MSLQVDEAIARIKAALMAKSTRRWSVTRGSGTSRAFIEVHAPPSRRKAPYGYMSDEDRVELSRLFGGLGVGHQGLTIGPVFRLKCVIAIESLAQGDAPEFVQCFAVFQQGIDDKLVGRPLEISVRREDADEAAKEFAVGARCGYAVVPGRFVAD